ncbi:MULTISPECIES: hypothetical protein [Nostocales]|nr:hypothetical protein [Tolypothrix bouteillei]
MSIKEKETIYHIELVKHGVKYDVAARAAKILAFGLDEETLTEEEKQLVKEACKIWLKQHQRINSILSKY